jgi:uncharacterized membrane protein
MSDLKLTPSLLSMLERIEQHSGTLLLLAVTASGGQDGKLNKLRGARYVVKCDHPSVTDRAWPAEALAITEAGRTALAKHRTLPRSGKTAPWAKQKSPRRRGRRSRRQKVIFRRTQLGDDWFALQAEAFARFFGTPTFLIAQTVIVAIWILVNVLGLTTFDIYPFILLNLAFSLQAAYAAPLILLAQTRQADRDAAHALADAEHREALHSASEERAALAADQTTLLVEMLQQNTELTETVKALTERVEALTLEVHKAVIDTRTS